MAVIDNRLDLAIRELRTLAEVPGDWRKHAGRIVDRFRQALHDGGYLWAAAALSPFCESVEPMQAIQVIEGVAMKLQEEREIVSRYAFRVRSKR